MNNTVTLKELSDTKIFYKFLDKNNEELIYHNSQTREPLYKQQNYIEKYELQDLQSIILEDLKKHNYIALKKIGDYTDTSITDSYENALLFISDSNLNNYQFNFYNETIELLENNNHPLQNKHTPYLCYEINTGMLYKGITHFSIIYKNNKNENECQAFIKNTMCIEHNISLKNKPYEIIILSKQDYLKNIDIYESIVPVNKTNYKFSLNNKKIEIKDFEFNELLTNDGPEIKIIKILKNYFYCVLTNKEYIPNEFTKTKEFILFCKEHAALLIKLINKVCFDIFGDYYEINEN
ncbi:MAG: hypothetical protein SOW31_11220 [Treponema sp.]|nr:hypothetical protein [Treponema sp.]